MKHIGGQAVIEGVMMKSERNMATSVRLKNRKIKTQKRKLRRKKKFLRLPFVRGFTNLIEILILGIQTLIWSANQQLPEKEEKISNKEVAVTLILSFAFGILLFVIVPYVLARIFITKGFIFNIIDGILRLAVFLIYIIAISFIKDVKTMFRYHGAEHKAVNCHEAKLPLTVKNCKEFTTLNPRCGTSFIFIVLVISILVFTLIEGPWYVKISARILLIPVIAAVSYELLKLASKFQKNIIMKIINYPGLLIQRITTKEPTKKQIEVAIRSLKTVLAMEK